MGPNSARKDLGPDIDQDFETAKLNFETLRRQNLALRGTLKTSLSEVRDSLTALRVTVDQLRETQDATSKQGGESSHPALDVLTARECEVLRLIGEGHTTKEIAHLLRIAFRTAVNHRSNIMSKLEIHNVAGLTRLAIDSGLIR